MNLKNAAFVRPSSRIKHKKKLCNKKDVPARKHGIWRIMSIRSITRMRPRSSRFLKFGHQRDHLRRNPRRINCRFRTSVHMLTRKDLDSAELETVRVSRNPTKVITANGKEQTNEEATVYVHDFELCVTVQILQDTLAVLRQALRRTRIFI